MPEPALITLLAIGATIAAIWLIPWKATIRLAIPLVAIIALAALAAHHHIDPHTVLQTIVPDFGGTTP